jgi:hypothetical protein
VDTEEKKLTSSEIEEMLREVEEIHRPRRTVNQNRKPKKRIRLDRIIAFSVLALLLVAVVVIVVKMFKGSPLTSKEEDTTKAYTSSPLVDDKYPEITELVQNYLSAYLIADDEKRMNTIRECVVDLDDLNNIKRREYVKSYSDVECYTKDGPYDDTYIVYAYYQVTYKNISTADPNITVFYVMRQGETNNVYIKNKIPDDVKEYIEQISADKDVQALFSDVNEEHEAARTKDENLDKFLLSLEKKAATKKE